MPTTKIDPLSQLGPWMVVRHRKRIQNTKPDVAQINSQVPSILGPYSPSAGPNTPSFLSTSELATISNKAQLKNTKIVKDKPHITSSSNSLNQLAYLPLQFHEDLTPLPIDFIYRAQNQIVISTPSHKQSSSATKSEKKNSVH